MLETREIEAFLAVAEELHFGRAAERLRLSTSRVSNLVRVVERSVGHALFERTSRVVRLTPPGAQLFAELRLAYVQLEHALDRARAFEELQEAVLRAGFSSTVPERLRHTMIAAFEERHPQCRVVASSLPTTDLFRWKGREWPVDVFVTWMPADRTPMEPSVRVGPVVHRVPRAVLVGCGHPLAGRSQLDVEDLSGHVIVHPELPDWFAAHWAPASTPAGLPLTYRHLPAHYVEDVLRVVAQGELVHLTFASLLEAYRRPGVELVALTGLAAMPVRAVWPAGGDERWRRRFAQTVLAPEGSLPVP